MSEVADDGLTEAQRTWRFGVESLISYRYLGTSSGRLAVTVCRFVFV